MQETYTCCVYRSREEKDLTCEPEDRECIEEYQQYQNKYYIAALAILLFTMVLTCVWCINSKIKDIRVNRRKKAMKIDSLHSNKVDDKYKMDNPDS